MSLFATRLALVASAAVAWVSVTLSSVPAGLPRPAQDATQAVQKPPQAQQPSFRSGVELVVVDVAAIGRDGVPVKGLTAEDFTVSIDGGPRRIASIQFVDQSTGETPAAAALPAARYTSNESGGPGRLILIVVDESSIRFGGFLAAAQSIDRLLAGFGPTDRIALATVPGPRVLVEFTADRAAIARATKTIIGTATANEPRGQWYVSVSESFAFAREDAAVIQEVFTRECPPSGPARLACEASLQMDARWIVTTERDRTHELIRSLRGIFGALRAIDAPKLVVVFSEGFASPEAPADFAVLGNDAAEARAVIYAMRLDRSLFDASRSKPIPLRSVFEERSTAIAGLDALAGIARGKAFDVIGPVDIPFQRFAAEVSGYYLIGVEPEANDRDGKPHQIRVEVGRPGVTVRSRREFAYRRVVTDDTKILASAIGSPLTATDLPLRVGTFSLPHDDPSKVFVLIVGEIGRAALKEGSALVGFVLTDANGKDTLTARQRLTLPAVESGALLFTGKFPVPAGTYKLKFAAVHEGRAGSVEHRVVAVLTPPGAARARPAGSTPQIGDLIIMPPTAIRGTYAPSLDGRIRGDQIVGLAQVGSDPRAKDGWTYVFEVVKQEESPVLVSAPGVPDRAAKGRCRSVEAHVDARLLPPGDYGLRLTVSGPGAPPAPLFARFSLVRLPPSERSAALAGTTPVPLPGAARFQTQDVLEPAVVGPFLEEVAKLAPASSRPALEQAKLGQFDQALRQLKSGDRSDPAGPFVRGLSLLGSGRTNDAAVAFREAIAAAPQLLVGAFYIGACYAAGGMDAQAISAWQTSLIALGQFPAVYRVLADALIRTGQPDRAQRFLDEAVQKWPEDDMLRARVMRADVEAGRYEKVLERADPIIARQPSDTATLFLAMQAIFQAVLDGKDTRVDLLLPRLQHYDELYVAAGGPQQALAAEWVSFLRTR